MAYRLLTKRYGKGAYSVRPTVRIGKGKSTTFYINEAARAILPADTTHVDLCVDPEQSILCIRKSTSNGRKLSKPTTLGAVRFTCAQLTEACPDIDCRCYYVQDEDSAILLQYN